MDGSQQGSSNSPAPFLTKTYEMVDDPITNPVVSWSGTGCSFVVWNPPEFARDLLPKYFKHNNFSSFVRQLNTYGFRKIDPDQWEFANEEFIRGQKHLLKNIYRRKPIHSHSTQNQSVPLSATEKHELEEEIKRLEHDKNLLQLELQWHERENQEYAFQIQSLSTRLSNMEHRQMQLIAFVAQLMQKPGLVSILKQQSEVHNKKRRLLNSNHYNGFNMDDNQTFAPQKENSSAISAPILNLELVEKLDLSLNFWEKIMYEVGETLTEEMHDFGLLSHPSPIDFRQVHASSGDSDVDGQPYSPRSYPSTPRSVNIHSSSPELAGSTNHANYPAISALSVDIDSRSNSFGIDVNLKPAVAPEAEASKEQVAGANDGFWEQFLTETPGSSNTKRSPKEEILMVTE